MKNKGKRYRFESSPDAVESQKRLSRRANTSRDYASLQRMGRMVRIGGIVLALVLLAYGGYAITHGVIPYVEEKMNSSVVPEEPSSMSEVSLDKPLLYDALGLPIYENDFSLRIINPNHPAAADDIPELTLFQSAMVDERIRPALDAMFAAALEDGVELSAVGGYVSYVEQTTAYNDRVRLLEKEGLTSIMAANNAEKQVGRAGMCDLQTGLCVRISGDAETFNTTEAYEWLNNNAQTYGFVFRYPKGAEDITGHETDLTIIRYVGADNARQMRRLNMCLEEYAEHISKQG